MQPEATSKKVATDVNHRNTVAYNEYITWRAIGGMIVSETGAMSPLTLEGFCERFNIDRTTTWRWSKEPGLAEKIEKRMHEIAPLSRVVAAWNRLFLIGMSSLGKPDKDGKPGAGHLHSDQRAAVDALWKYVGNFGTTVVPKQRVEHDVGNNLADLINTARKKQIIEGEIVDDTGTSA